MNILSDLDDIIEVSSTKEVAMAIDQEWARTQISEFNMVYQDNGGFRQPTNIDMLGNELQVSDWILCMRDAHGGGQTLELNRIEKIGKTFLSCLAHKSTDRNIQIRPNACIKTSIEEFQKIKNIYSKFSI